MIDCVYRFGIGTKEDVFWLKRESVFPFPPQIGMAVDVGCGLAKIVCFCVNLDGSLWISLNPWRRLSEEGVFEDIAHLRSFGWRADTKCYDEITSVEYDEAYEGLLVVKYGEQKIIVSDFQLKCLNAIGEYSTVLTKVENGECVNAPPIM